MKTLAKRILEKSEPLWEMSNLGEKRTGLPVYVFVSVCDHPAGPRIKVGQTRSSFRNHEENFSVSISDDPEVVAGDPRGIVNSRTLRKVFDWVIKNKDTLLNYWNDELDTDDMIDKIQKV